MDTFAREAKRLERRKTRARASRLIDEALSGAPLSSETDFAKIMNEPTPPDTDHRFGFRLDGFDDDTVDYPGLGPESSPLDKVDAAVAYSFNPDIDGGEHPYSFPHIKISRSWESLEDVERSGHVCADPPGFDAPNIPSNRNRKGYEGKPLLASTAPFLVGLMAGIMVIVAYLQLMGNKSSMKSSLIRRHDGGRPLVPVDNISYMGGPEINVFMEDEGGSGWEGTSQATASGEEVTGSLRASKKGSEPNPSAHASGPREEQIDKTTDRDQQTAQVEEELDLADFCDTCQWKDSAFTCKSRVHWLTTHYNVTEIDAKRNNLKHCTTPVDQSAESSLANFCDTCQWKSSAFSCAWRVQKLTEHFNVTVIEAKKATLKYCTAPDENSGEPGEDEEELDLADFCDTCQWKDSAFTCKSRVHWLTTHYNITEIEAKRNNLEHCTAPVDEDVESSVANFCDTCQWKRSAYNCAWRVDWIIENYNVTEIAAKRATLKYCTAPDDKSTEAGDDS